MVGRGCGCPWPIDAIEWCNGWPPWLLTELNHGCKTIGGMEWISIPPCQVSQWSAIIYLDAEYSHSFEEGPSHQLEGGLLPSLYQARGKINSTKPSNKPDKNLYPNGYQMNPTMRHKGMPEQSWREEVAGEEYLSPKLLDCNKQCG